MGNTLKKMDNSPVMMEKPDDLTLEECQEANFDLVMTLANQGLWHICEQIFGYLDYKTVENCRKVSELWNESLERIALIKFLQEFGDRDVEYTNEKVSTIVAGWKNAGKMFGAQASLEDLQEVKDSLLRLAIGNDKCCPYPVHEAAKIGALKLMEFILRTSFDMNTEDNCGSIAWHEACSYGQTETAQLIIRSLKDFDLNAKDNHGSTAWHNACRNGKTETAKSIIQSSKDFGIDLNAKDNCGRTAWHLACAFGKTETAQLIIQYSKDFGIDLNAKNDYGNTAWHFACSIGKIDTAQLIVQSSKDFGIDLNAKNNEGNAALHKACIDGQTETVQIILKNWKEFAIDIKAQNKFGKTALDLINHCKGGKRNQIKKMLEKEYFRNHVT